MKKFNFIIAAVCLVALAQSAWASEGRTLVSCRSSDAAYSMVTLWHDGLGHRYAQIVYNYSAANLVCVNDLRSEIHCIGFWKEQTKCDDACKRN